MEMPRSHEPSKYHKDGDELLRYKIQTYFCIYRNMYHKAAWIAVFIQKWIVGQCT